MVSVVVSTLHAILDDATVPCVLVVLVTVDVGVWQQAPSVLVDGMRLMNAALMVVGRELAVGMELLAPVVVVQRQPLYQ